MQLNRRETEFLGNIRILDGDSLIQRTSFNPLRGQTARGYGGTAPEGLETHIFDNALFVDFDLQAHYVSAGGSANEACSHHGVVFVEGANVSRPLIVVNNLHHENHKSLKI